MKLDGQYTCSFRLNSCTDMAIYKVDVFLEHRRTVLVNAFSPEEALIILSRQPETWTGHAAIRGELVNWRNVSEPELMYE